MSFWSKVATPFKWIGKIIVDATVELPKLITAGEVAAAQVPTLVTDTGIVLNDVEAVAVDALGNAEPAFTALEEFAVAAESAASAGLTNLSEDEAAMAAAQAFYTALKNSKFSTTLTAFKQMVTDWDDLKGKIKSASDAVVAAAEGAEQS